MNRKVSIGISNHLFYENGEFCIPGHGLKYLDDMPGVEWKIIGGDMSHVSPEQADGLDMIITLLSTVTAESLAGNERLLAVLCNAAGYDPVDVPALTEAGVTVCNTPKAVLPSPSRRSRTGASTPRCSICSSARTFRTWRWRARPI